VTATLQCVVLDCPDDEELARFYEALLGGDLGVSDLATAHQEALAAGATLLDDTRSSWHVYADPAGHPFCLVRGSAE
jgi:hypothetical protein